jgi:hypothetical protein
MPQQQFVTLNLSKHAISSILALVAHRHRGVKAARMIVFMFSECLGRPRELPDVPTPNRSDNEPLATAFVVRCHLALQMAEWELLRAA